MILVIGIIGAVAAPMFDTSTIDVSVAGDMAQGDIQYVQELAMTRDQNVSIIFNPGSSYVVPADPGPVVCESWPNSRTRPGYATSILMGRVARALSGATKALETYCRSESAVWVETLA